MKRLLTAAVAVLLTAAAGCATTDDRARPAGGRTLVVALDLPFQGAASDTSESVANAADIYLDEIGAMAGPYRIELRRYDNATATKGSWDDATCVRNATDHVAATDEVAVLGAANSGCTKLQLPTLNQDPAGPMLMVSHSNTNPGLTKPWEQGEPEKYFPTGRRGYARVITTDEYQGAAAAQFAARDLKVGRCAVLHDNQTYGQGVAEAFAEEAARQGVTVLDRGAWDARATTYTALFQAVKATDADCVFLSGIYDNNGGQLVKDKVAVLGPNSGAVPLIVPDGFFGFRDFQRLPAAEGAYLTFGGLGLAQMKAAGGAAARLLADYRARHGSEPASAYALYGVQALQVILAAVARSDGSRRGVRDQVFEGTGVSVPAAQAMLGKDVRIDPATGDVNVRDLSVLRMTGGAETFLKAWPLP
ncbi:branched-chain amino acid ABC transporter substrate-binding protein [Luedemannella helvata]|uniref:branched-chain amino acid ABC transporter substrate-binding protein n=1 Tax=Luedemannella helvata TaxID=349315 RepID=UPI0031D1494E